MKRIKLFNWNGFTDDVQRILDKFDDNYDVNIHWIDDCVSELKNRRESSGPVVPVTPMGRPRTRNFMKHRALQLERANRINSSLRSNSTPKIGKSVAISAVPHYLKKSASLKKKLANKIKNSGKKAKKTAQVTKTKDPIRVNLFKSAFPKGKDPIEDVAPGVVATTSKEAKETNPTAGRSTRAKSVKVAVTKVERKPTTVRGQPKQAQIAGRLKDNLESLADLLISPVRARPQENPSGPGFKSPIKVIKSKIDTGLEQIKEAKRRKKDDEANKQPVMVVLSSKSDEEVELREVCDKSLQVTLKSVSESFAIPKDLNPCVLLVDIAESLKNAMIANANKTIATPPVKLPLNNVPKNSLLPMNVERLRKSERVPNIFHSTPTGNTHLKPLIMLEKLDLTRISTGDSPPGRPLDNSDASFNCQRIAKHSVVVIEESVQIIEDVMPSVPIPRSDKMPHAIKLNAVTATAPGVPSGKLDVELDKMDNIASVPSNQLKNLIRPAIHPNQNSTPAATNIGKVPIQVNVVSTVDAVVQPKNVDLKYCRIEEEEEVSSYEITPVRKKKKFLPSTTDDYNIRDLDSEDSTDDEYRPRKVIPSWARSQNLRPLLERQAMIPLLDVHRLFCSRVHENLDLKRIFTNSKREHKLNKRTSSAFWKHPPAKRSHH